MGRSVALWMIGAAALGGSPGCRLIFKCRLDTSELALVSRKLLAVASPKLVEKMIVLISPCVEDAIFDEKIAGRMCEACLSKE